MTRTDRIRWLLAALTAFISVIGFDVARQTGRIDSAFVFVVMPTLMALALIFAPIKATHGRVFQVVTVCLLMSAVFLHEGIICVIIAAPLVYAIAHGVTALVMWIIAEHRRYAFVLPLILLAGMEGVTPQARIGPHQTVEVTRVVSLSSAQVAARVANGPRPTEQRSIPLRVLGVPTPHSVAGPGLEVDERWIFSYPGSSHGPGGQTVFEVKSHADGELVFGIVEDTAITARWFDWDRAELSWQPIDGGHTRVRLRIDYERGLDPSWYFGPINDALLREGAGHLLDMLDLP